METSANAQIIRCPKCGAKNRVVPGAQGEAVCGRCKTPLTAEIHPLIITDQSFAEEVERSPLPVLIDFWASWCKPCRRENPNVVKAYEKYNEDGFEVFSVSLDKKGFKSRWIAAIEQDGLVWPYHVSTMEGFSTQAARDYAVNSIPFTVLIDAEGKVIATNLRGPRLEEELQRIFGH